MRLAFIIQDPAGPLGAYVRAMVPELLASGHDAWLLDDAARGADGVRMVIDATLLPALVAQRPISLLQDAVVLVPPGMPKDAPSLALMRQDHHAWQPRVIATDAAVAHMLDAEFEITGGRLALIPPGLATASRSPGSGGAGCAILTVGALGSASGYDVLLKALSRLADLEWTLNILGTTARGGMRTGSGLGTVDGTLEAALAEQAGRLGLAGRVRIVREPASHLLEALWREADLFALAARDQSGADTIAEALRRGLPVAATTVPEAAPEDVVPPGAGTVSLAEDDAALSKCLRRLVFDSALRQTMADTAWHIGQQQPSWAVQAARLVEHLG